MRCIFCLFQLSAYVCVLFGFYGAQASAQIPLASSLTQKHAACQSLSQFRMNPVFCMQQIDPLGSAHWRGKIDGALRSQFGTQISPFCYLAYRDQWGSGLSAEKMRMTFQASVDSFLQKIFENILFDCGNKYPELNPYLQDLISQARRSVIDCIDDSSGKFSGRFGYFENQNLMFSPLAQSGSLDSNGLIDPLVMIYKPLLILKNSVFLSALVLSPDDLNTVVHEFFHATRANNFPESHNQVEARSGLEGFCDRNIFDDRVNMLAQLCQPSYKMKFLNREQVYHEDLIFDRISSCGMHKGCLDLFLKKYPESQSLYVHVYKPSLELDTDSAINLCQKIYRRGSLQKKFKTFDVYLARNASFQYKYKKLTHLIRRFYPKQKNVLSMHILKELLDASQLRGLQSISLSSIFNQYFEWRGDDLILKNMPSERFSERDQFSTAAFFSILALGKQMAIDSSLRKPEEQALYQFVLALGRRFLFFDRFAQVVLTSHSFHHDFQLSDEQKKNLPESIVHEVQEYNALYHDYEAQFGMSF